MSGADYSDAASVGIPRGSIFTITGLNLAPSALPASGTPLSTQLNGVRVKIWNGPEASASVLAEAPLLYVSPTQINAILPSSIPVGQRYVSVITAAGDTERLPALVTGGRFAAFARGGQGFGPAVVQQYDATGSPSLNQLSASARPGATLSLWGTGLGALPSGSDADVPAAAQIRSDVMVYVSGAAVPPTYAGRAPGLPGVDQINFVLPTNVREDCFVPVQVVTGGLLSGVVSVAVSSTGSTCATEFGLTAGSLASLDQGGVVRAAVLRLNSLTSTSDGSVQQSAEAWEAAYDLSHLSVLATAAYPPPAKGYAACSRTPAEDRGYGLLALSGGAPVPSIKGPSGCTWAFSSSGSLVSGYGGLGCLATTYRFGPGPSGGGAFDVSGVFPQPKAATAVAGVSAQKSGRQLSASWSAAPGPNDELTLTAGSYETEPGIFGAVPSRTNRNQISCAATGVTAPFLFPEADTAWALQYPSIAPVSVSLTTVIDQIAQTGAPSLDFVLVRTSNSVVDQAQIK